jgi:uncharacterized membrane protein YdbT with pleckstrin-like domain
MAVPEVQAGLFVMAGILVLSILVTRLRHVYTVTNQRVVERQGLFIKHIYEIRIPDIKSLHLHQSFLQRLLGVGTLEFNSVAGAQAEVMFWGIDGPSTVHALIRQFQCRTPTLEVAMLGLSG